MAIPSLTPSTAVESPAGPERQLAAPRVRPPEWGRRKVRFPFTISPLTPSPKNQLMWYVPAVPVPFTLDSAEGAFAEMVAAWTAVQNQTAHTVAAWASVDTQNRQLIDTAKPAIS